MVLPAANRGMDPNIAEYSASFRTVPGWKPSLPGDALDRVSFKNALNDNNSQQLQKHLLVSGDQAAASSIRIIRSFDLWNRRPRQEPFVALIQVDLAPNVANRRSEDGNRYTQQNLIELVGLRSPPNHDTHNRKYHVHCAIACMPKEGAVNGK